MSWQICTKFKMTFAALRSLLKGKSDLRRRSLFQICGLLGPKLNNGGQFCGDKKVKNVITAALNSCGFTANWCIIVDYWILSSFSLPAAIKYRTFFFQSLKSTQRTFFNISLSKITSFKSVFIPTLINNWHVIGNNSTLSLSIKMHYYVLYHILS